MTQPTSPERLAAVLHAAQYLSNLSPQQDPWAELAQALKTFFRCDLVLIVRAGQDGEPQLVHAFTPGIPAAGILAQARDEARAVLDSGFLGAQTLAEPPCSLAFLPLLRDRRTAALAIVGRGGAEPYAKEDLEILLALGGLFGNVVARVETERELRDYQENLEGLVARRTEELEGSNASLLREISERERAEEERRKFEERAIQAQKLEALGVLVAGVAHNINNVLTIIMGTASLRELLVTSPPDREAYQSIGKACQRGRDVVKSLIHFAQPTLSSQALFDLHGLVKEVAGLMESTSRNRVQVVEALAPGAAWINGDAGTIDHVLVNLCMNAMEAMPDGGTITFRTRILEPDWVELDVEDHGTGMTPEILAHALDPFFTTKPVGKGTGLGLSMSYGVMAAHGGSLEMASQPGQGTTVRLRFPLVPPPAQAGVPSVPAPALRSMTVLMVDDDADVRFLMTRMLKKAGVRQVRTCAGGEEAIENLDSGELPDLVILDQNMPGLTGIQTMDRIRALHPHLPILISSGQPDIETWDCFRQPRVAVISKPFTLEEISGKLALIFS
jgi:signal transduction histidine kinase